MKPFLAMISLVALALTLLEGNVVVPLKAQSAAGQTPTAQSPAAPRWQTDAGGKMAFDVASVKLNKCGGYPPTCPIDSNVILVPGDAYSPNGGLLRVTNWPMMPFIVFAYKLDANAYQTLGPQLPKWAVADRFDIQARAAESNPTKDQMRLMMQSLLAERFKLAVHIETRQLPVFALVLDKPGKLGPKLRLHLDDPPCAPADSPGQATVGGGYPAICGILQGPNIPGQRNLGARNMPMGLIGSWLSATGILGRPVLDKTGLDGTFDFMIEWTPEPNGPPPAGADAQATPSGPTFLEALKDQLGLKLVSRTGPVDVLVIDHIEELSAN